MKITYVRNDKLIMPKIMLASVNQSVKSLFQHGKNSSVRYNVSLK